MKQIYMLLFLLFLPWTLTAHDLIIKNGTLGVDATVQKIEKIIASQEALSIFTIIDHKAAADKAGMKLSETKVILFGNPKMGTKFMQKDHLTAIDLPLKILVYADQGTTKIVYRDPRSWSKGFELAGVKLLDKMVNALDKITTKAMQ